MPFKKLLIANRGEIAIRIARAAGEAGLTSVAIHPADDAASLHGVIVEADAGADAQIEHAVGVQDVHVIDRPLNPPPNQPAERGVVKHRVDVVDLLRARFLHRSFPEIRAYRARRPL